MVIEQLGLQAAELLSVTNAGEARSLRGLAEMATRQVPGCSGANAVVLYDGEAISLAATHPDLAELADLQLTAGDGPLVAAAQTRMPVSCPDTLDETRWPEYTRAALCHGVRCSVHLVRELPRSALVLSLSGVRPRVLDADSDPTADALAAFGGAMLANATAYGEAQQMASQLKDAVVARSVVDQAKGILMHAVGCDADDALRRLRQESQRRHVKVTEVARQVVESRSRHPGGLRPVRENETALDHMLRERRCARDDRLPGGGGTVYFHNPGAGPAQEARAPRMTTSRPPLAERLDLAPHPEGGWFRETFRSSVSFCPEGYGGPRSAATAIYFLLHPGERSRWHVVRSDELWFWQGGGALDLRMGGSGAEPGDGTAVLLGGDLGAGQQPQARVPGGVWQCAAPAGDAPVLVSCVVAPGFDFDDFRLG